MAQGNPPADADEGPILDDLERSTVEGDPVVQRLIVMFLGSGLILVILFVFLIRIDGGEVPDSLIALGSSAIGALAGLLTATRGSTTAGGGRRDRRSVRQRRAARK